jgi:hypothetical protein
MNLCSLGIKGDVGIMQKNDPIVACFTSEFQVNSDFKINEDDFEISARDWIKGAKVNNIQLTYDRISQILFTTHKPVP